MMIPLGSSGGRQLTNTEDESSTFSCSSSGGKEGPEGERRAGSVIGVQKQGLTAVECILSCWGIWHIVWRPSVSSCPHQLGTGAGGTSTMKGEWTGVQVMKRGVTGWLVLIMSLRVVQTPLSWLTDRTAGQMRATTTPRDCITASYLPLMSTMNSPGGWTVASQDIDPNINEQAIAGTSRHAYFRHLNLDRNQN